MLEFAPGFGLAQTAFRLDPRILCFLLGEPAFDDRLAVFVSDLLGIESQALPPSHAALLDQILDTWDLDAQPSPLLQLCGSDFAAKSNLVAHLCDALDSSFCILSIATLPATSHDLHQLKIRWEREAILGERVLLIDCEEISTANPARARAITLWIESLRTPTILSTIDRLVLPQRAVASFDVPRLTFAEKKGLWDFHLGDRAPELNGAVSRICFRFDLSSTAIQTACDRARTVDESLLGHTLWSLCRHHARPRLDDLAQRIGATATWDDLILPERQHQILADIATQLEHQSTVYHEWGFAGQSERGLGLTALFHGASGTGKTTAAEVLANRLHLDLYRIDLSATVSKYIGETEKNLRRIFDAAAVGGAILLFDEADALFGKRGEVKDSRDRHANVEVSYLLQRLEAYQGLAILTTNLKNALDAAFLRRIRFMVEFPFPKAEYRAEIWRRAFPAKTPTLGLDYKKLGQLQVSGGNIRNIALNAAFLAADAEEPVMMKHLLQATKREYLKLQNQLSENEIRGWVVA